MIQQGNEKWHYDRCGQFTASRVSDILAVQADKFKVIRPTGTIAKVFATMKEATAGLEDFKALAKKDPELFHVKHFPGEPLKAFQDYLAEVLCGQLTGEPTMMPETFQMRWGHDNEPFALDAYEIITGNIVQPCGFIAASKAPLKGIYGASPDGLVDEAGQVEVKCPVNSTYHLQCFWQGIPESHQPQLQGQLLATGRSWVDFISFDPRMPKHLRLFVQRQLAVPEWQDKISLGVLRMNQAMKEIQKKLPKE